MAVAELVDAPALALLDALAAVRDVPAPLGREAERVALLAHASAELRGVYLRDLGQVGAAVLAASGARGRADLLAQVGGVPVWQGRRDAALAARLAAVPGLSGAVAGGAVELEAALLLVKAWRALPSRLHEQELASALIALAGLVDLRDLRAKVDELCGALAPEVTDGDLADAREAAELTLVDIGSRTRLSGECDVLTGELVREVLAARAEADRGLDDARTGPQRAMAALVAVLEAAAGRPVEDGGVPGEPGLVVVTTVDDLVRASDVTPDRVDPDDAVLDLFRGTDLLDDAAEGAGAAGVGAAAGPAGSPQHQELDDVRRAARPRWTTCTRGGTPVGPRTLAALACQSVLARLVLSPLGSPLDSSPRARQLSRRGRRALEHRAAYRCERLGCGRRAAVCVPHHVVPFALGGPSTLSNTVLLCVNCHHLLHDRQQALELTGGRRIGPRGWLRAGPVEEEPLFGASPGGSPPGG